MKLRSLLPALVVGVSALCSQAYATTFKFAFQGDLNSLDPYTLNESFTQGVLSNVYESLTARDKDLKIVPGLAESWEMIDPLKWRFHLRHGVKFAGGEPFTADDVLFSLDRVRTPGSEFKTRVPADMKAIKVDDYTVDFILTAPNPLLIAEWDTWFMMSKTWADANGATQVQSSHATELSPFALKADGTGPFIIESHQPGVKTTFKPNPNYWGKKRHNFDEVTFQTIKQDATRVAALLSGEVDMIEPVPVQDQDRVNASPNARVLSGPELRTIFLNMDSKRDELLYSSVKGKNPFKDVRVRRAFNEAIDIEAIKTKVMRGRSTPTPLLISPLLFSKAGEFKRWPFDVADAKKLMAAAGYPDGFQLTMDCPNDRYVNDEAICQAVAAMLSKINVKIALNAQPKVKFFAKANAPSFDTSFSMLGWTPSGFDSLNVLTNIIGCRDDKGTGGPFNYGGYCNPAVTDLTNKLKAETDPAKRDDIIAAAYKIVHDDAGFIPLHQQALSWGVSKKVDMIQRADDFIMFSWATKKE